jgi:ABC-2 type transport system ATP-binding protein
MARAAIWAMLERERSRALIVISTSYLDETAACDRLVYVDDGRVVAVGTPAELRARVELELYRAWGDDPRTIARAARTLPYVDGARATGRFARVEVRRAAAPGAAQVVRDLQRLPAAGVRFAEPASIDMESTLLALARGVTA